MFFSQFIVAAVAVFVGWLSILGFLGGSGGVQLVGLLFVVFAGETAYRYLRIPHTIVWRDGATIEFKAILRTMAMAPSEIISVKPAEPSFLLLRSRRGNVLLLDQFDGMHE